jgi:hypothetical protein
MEREIISIIGHDLAALFFKAFFGCIVYIPEHIDSSHELVLCIGIDASKKLSRQFSGTTIAVPTGYRSRIAARNRCIINDRNNGHSLNELAVKYQLTTRQLFTICKQPKLK